MSQLTSQLVPVVIYLGLVWFFGRTLIQPPSIIERFVSLQFSEIPDEVLGYCRQVTWAWTLLFAGIVVISILLILTGNDWSLTVLHGIITWLLMIALMLVEYVYRLWRFPFMRGQTPSIHATVQSAIKNKDQLW